MLPTPWIYRRLAAAAGWLSGRFASAIPARRRMRWRPLSSEAERVAVRDARRRDPANGGQARHPDRRLLVCARRQDPGVQLPCRYDHHVAQLGIMPDFASAVAASAPER